MPPPAPSTAALAASTATPLSTSCWETSDVFRYGVMFVITWGDTSIYNDVCCITTHLISPSRQQLLLYICLHLFPL